MKDKGIIATSEPYLQIEPQHAWHGDAIIQGNESGLRKLAAALLKACESMAAQSAASCRPVFASDGEGYEIVIMRQERLSDFREPFYTINVECHQPEAHKRAASPAARSEDK